MRFAETRLLVFDTETTGVQVRRDRVVEIGAALVLGSHLETRLVRINPGVPIPPETSAIHGIYDQDVANAPPFVEVAPRFLSYVNGLDGVPPLLVGFNVLAFDIPILNAELARAGLSARISRRGVLDLLVFARHGVRGLRSRRLGALCEHFGVPLTRAHSAVADSVAVVHLLFAFIEAGIIPDDVERALAEQARVAPLLGEESRRFGRWVYSDRGTGTLRVGAGRNVGRTLSEVGPEYLEHMLSTVSDLTRATKRAILAELARKDPPKGSTED